MSLKSELREERYYSYTCELERQVSKLSEDKSNYLKAAEIYLENIMLFSRNSITLDQLIENVKSITSDEFWNYCARKVKLNLSLDDCLEEYNNYLDDINSIANDMIYADEDDLSSIVLINKE